MDWCRIFIMPGTWNVSSSHPLNIVIILLSDDIFRSYWPASGSAHCKMRGMIYFRMEIHPPFRHGHQQIFLMKVELLWFSEMKIRSF